MGKKLCDLKKKKVLKKQGLVPVYRCRKCERTAEQEKVLCKPQPV